MNTTESTNLNIFKTVFEMSLSKVLNNGEIDVEEFTKPQMFYLRRINKQANFDQLRPKISIKKIYWK